MPRASIAGALLIALALPGYAAVNELGWDLDGALKQIDRQTKNFETAMADANAVWTGMDGGVLREARGRIYIGKNGAIRIDVAEPAERVILYARNEVQDFDPAAAVVNRYSLSKHRDRLEPFLSLGFTNTGRDLRDDFLVTLLGEQLLGSERVVGLELTPKKEKERVVVSKVVLWINEASWMPKKQIIENVGNRETLTIEYSGMSRNLKLNPDLFAGKWPRGTKRVRQ